jgi:hypothetical protein
MEDVASVYINLWFDEDNLPPLDNCQVADCVWTHTPSGSPTSTESPTDITLRFSVKLCPEANRPDLPQANTYVYVKTRKYNYGDLDIGDYVVLDDANDDARWEGKCAKITSIVAVDNPEGLTATGGWKDIHSQNNYKSCADCCADGLATHPNCNPTPSPSKTESPSPSPSPSETHTDVHIWEVIKCSQDSNSGYFPGIDPSSEKYIAQFDFVIPTEAGGYPLPDVIAARDKLFMSYGMGGAGYPLDEFFGCVSIHKEAPDSNPQIRVKKDVGFNCPEGPGDTCWVDPSPTPSPTPSVSATEKPDFWIYKVRTCESLWSRKDGKYSKPCSTGSIKYWYSEEYLGLDPSSRVQEHTEGGPSGITMCYTCFEEEVSSLNYKEGQFGTLLAAAGHEPYVPGLTCQTCRPQTPTPPSPTPTSSYSATPSVTPSPDSFANLYAYRCNKDYVGSNDAAGRYYFSITCPDLIGLTPQEIARQLNLKAELFGGADHNAQPDKRCGLTIGTPEACLMFPVFPVENGPETGTKIVAPGLNPIGDLWNTAAFKVHPAGSLGKGCWDQGVCPPTPSDSFSPPSPTPSMTPSFSATPSMTPSLTEKPTEFYYSSKSCFKLVDLKRRVPNASCQAKLGERKYFKTSTEIPLETIQSTGQGNYNQAGQGFVVDVNQTKDKSTCVTCFEFLGTDLDDPASSELQNAKNYAVELPVDSSGMPTAPARKIDDCEECVPETPTPPSPTPTFSATPSLMPSPTPSVTELLWYQLLEYDKLDPTASGENPATWDCKRSKDKKSKYVYCQLPYDVGVECDKRAKDKVNGKLWVKINRDGVEKCAICNGQDEFNTDPAATFVAESSDWRSCYDCYGIKIPGEPTPTPATPSVTPSVTSTPTYSEADDPYGWIDFDLLVIKRCEGYSTTGKPSRENGLQFFRVDPMAGGAKKVLRTAKTKVKNKSGHTFRRLGADGKTSECWCAADYEEYVCALNVFKTKGGKKGLSKVKSWIQLKMLDVCGGKPCQEGKDIFEFDEKGKMLGENGIDQIEGSNYKIHKRKQVQDDTKGNMWNEPDACSKCAMNPSRNPVPEFSWFDETADKSQTITLKRLDGIVEDVVEMDCGEVDGGGSVNVFSLKNAKPFGLIATELVAKDLGWGENSIAEWNLFDTCTGCKPQKVTSNCSEFKDTSDSATTQPFVASLAGGTQSKTLGVKGEQLPSGGKMYVLGSKKPRISIPSGKQIVNTFEMLGQPSSVPKKWATLFYDCVKCHVEGKFKIAGIEDGTDSTTKYQSINVNIKSGVIPHNIFARFKPTGGGLHGVHSKRWQDRLYEPDTKVLSWDFPDQGVIRDEAGTGFSWEIQVTNRSIGRLGVYHHPTTAGKNVHGYAYENPDSLVSQFMFNYAPMKGTKVLNSGRKSFYNPVAEIGKKAVSGHGCIEKGKSTRMGNKSGITSPKSGNINFIAGEEGEKNGFWPGKWWFYHTIALANTNGPSTIPPDDQVFKTIVVSFSFTILAPHAGAAGSSSSGAASKKK